MFSMPERVHALLEELHVDPDLVDSFTLSWDRYEGAKLEYRMQPVAELVEINIVKEIK